MFVSEGRCWCFYLFVFLLIFPPVLLWFHSFLLLPWSGVVAFFWKLYSLLLAGIPALRMWRQESKTVKTMRNKLSQKRKHFLTSSVQSDSIFSIFIFPFPSPSAWNLWKKNEENYFGAVSIFSVVMNTFVVSYRTVSEARSFDETTIHPAVRRPAQYYQSDVSSISTVGMFVH